MEQPKIIEVRKVYWELKHTVDEIENIFALFGKNKDREAINMLSNLQDNTVRYIRIITEGMTDDDLMPF